MTANLPPKFMNPAANLPLSLVGLNRRSFLRRSGLIAAMTPFAAMLLGGNQQANAAQLPFPIGPDLDIAILNFALNLEYLEGEYYTYGVTGQSITQQGVTVSGSGTQGGVTIKSNPQVPFQSTALQQFAEEISRDEIAHIKFLQDTITKLGGTPVARPQLDLLNSFNTIGAASGIGSPLDPFADEVSFFLGGYSLTDVGVTAYHGAAPLLYNKTVLSGSAGILATESYHDAVLRLSIYQAGTDARNKAGLVSDLRDKLDDGGKKDKDQGVVNADGTANIVPADGNSIAFSRNTRQVLNIVYGGFKAANGGFFPNAVNGDIK